MASGSGCKRNRQATALRTPALVMLPPSSQIESEVGFGELEAVELQPGGSGLVVTTANRWVLHRLRGGGRGLAWLPAWC